MTPVRFRWGILLVLIGGLILLRNLDKLDDSFWIDLIIYFPFFLIAVGIEKIFTGSRLQFISYLTTIALVAGAVYVAYSVSGGIGRSSFFTRTTFVEDWDSSVENLRAVLRLGDGSLTIRDSGDDMVYARFREFTHKPYINYSKEGNEAHVSFQDHSRRLFGGTIGIETDEPDDWYMSFSRQVPLFLECFGSNSDIHLNLSTTPLRQLTLEADDADIYLKLGGLLPNVGVSVSGDESKLRLRIPRDAGLRVSGMDHDRLLSRLGLVKNDGYFMNSGYDTLQNKITVDLDDRFRSLSIDFY